MVEGGKEEAGMGRAQAERIMARSTSLVNIKKLLGLILISLRLFLKFFLLVSTHCTIFRSFSSPIPFLLLVKIAHSLYTLSGMPYPNLML